MKKQKRESSKKTTSSKQQQNTNWKQSVLDLRKNRFIKWFVAPAVIFLALFFVFQPHYAGNFSNGFYLDKGDGYQNVWNIWWVNDAITTEHTTPYFTHDLEWPHGTTLVPQTMNIFNGLVAIPLMNVLSFSLIQAVNFAVLFSFVVGGLTMFWFIQKLHGKYWVSVVAGALFTFSSYHFAHAIGHLQLVSFEWIPLFLLAFWTLLEKLRYRDAFYASGALFLVLLCDYYYLLWCIMLGILWAAWQLYKKKLVLNKKTLKVLGLFAGLSLVLVGPLMYQLFSLSRGNQLLGSHDATLFSLDPLAVIIPGGTWHWGNLTLPYWKNLPYMAETSVFFGVGIIATLLIGLVKRRKLKMPSWLNFWWAILIIFGVLALGPRLSLFGRHHLKIPLPYAVLEHLMPSLKISGMPIRWILISLIAAIVLTSFILTKINTKTTKGKLLVALFIGVSLIDLYPTRLPLSIPTHYKYVSFLRAQPKSGVIDNAALSSSEALYNQTQHDFPMAFGYVTRIPKSVDEKNFHIFAALEEGRLGELCKNYKIRYLTLPPSRALGAQSYPIIYHDNDAVIYDLKNSESC